MPPCAPWIDNPLGRIVITNSAARPVGADRYPGMVIYETNTFRYWSWNGSQWVLIGGRVPQARVSASAPQNVNTSTFTTLAWNLENVDTDGFHDNVTNNTRLTAPAGLGGMYNIAFSEFCSNSAAGIVSAWIQVNGVGVRYGFVQVPNNGSDGVAVAGSANLILNAGDYAEVVVYQTSGSTRAFGAFGFFEATRIGPS